MLGGGAVLAFAPSQPAPHSSLPSPWAIIPAKAQPDQRCPGPHCTGELLHSTNKHAEAQSGCATAEVGLELEPLGQ